MKNPRYMLVDFLQGCADFCDRRWERADNFFYRTMWRLDPEARTYFSGPVTKDEK